MIISNKKRACFFTHESREQIEKEHYTISDIKILKELGFSVTVATKFKEIPWNCDLYFSWWTSGSILPLIKAKISKKPIIVIAGGQEAMFNRDSITNKPIGYLATPWYKKLATRITLRCATKVLAVSRYMIKDIKRLGANNPLVVYNCVDTKLFSPLNSSKKYITTIFNSYKNVVKIKRGEILIRSIPFVLKKFPKQKFIIIGEKGNASQNLKNLISKLGVNKNIELIGRINRLEMPKWLQESKAYVQISDTETFGLSVAEAMSCGTPVIVSNRGAIPEIVKNYGIYVDHNNPKSVASGIIDLLKKEKKYHTTGIEARSMIVKNFSYEKRKKSIKEIIKNI